MNAKWWCFITWHFPFSTFDCVWVCLLFSNCDFCTCEPNLTGWREVEIKASAKVSVLYVLCLCVVVYHVQLDLSCCCIFMLYLCTTCSQRYSVQKHMFSRVFSFSFRSRLIFEIFSKMSEQLRNLTQTFMPPSGWTNLSFCHQIKSLQKLNL